MQDQETDILSARESRIAVALFEMMKPQIENLLDHKIANTVKGIVDAEEFDINDHSGAIEDIVSDWVRYNVTITSTIDQEDSYV